MPTPPDATMKLEALGLEALCDRIVEGGTFRDIAKELDIGIASLSRWINADAERVSRVRAARTLSAMMLEDEARDVARDKTIPVDRGSLICSQLRWQAKVRNPREYGDKLELGGEIALSNLSAEELDARAATLARQIAEAMNTPPLPTEGA